MLELFHSLRSESANGTRKAGREEARLNAVERGLTRWWSQSRLLVARNRDEEAMARLSSDCRLTLYQESNRVLNDVLYSPIKNYSRVRYTCFAVSTNFLAFGSSTGGIYLFHHQDDRPAEYLYNVPNNYGRITCIQFSPEDQTVLAFGTAKGVLVVLQLLTQNQWSVIYASTNFTEASINHVVWETGLDFKLFVADENGHVYFIGKVTSVRALLSHPSPTLIFKADSKIYQLDVLEEYLVISTLNRSVVHDMKQGSIAQVGLKARPPGEYGLCLFTKETQSFESNRCIYAARPGARLWESDLAGNVRFTHQFKQNLATIPSTSVLNGEPLSTPKTKSTLASAPVFKKLLPFKFDSLTFLLTYSTEPQSALFLIDPIHAVIELWTNVFENIKDVQCSDTHVYILHYSKLYSDNMCLTLSRISVLTVEQAIAKLVTAKQWIQAVRTTLTHKNHFEVSTKDDLVTRDNLLCAWNNLQDNEKSFYSEFKTIIDSESNTSTAHQNTSSHTEGSSNCVNNQKTTAAAAAADNQQTISEITWNKRDDYGKVQREDNPFATLEQQVEKTLKKLRLNGLAKTWKCSQTCGYPKPQTHVQLSNTQVELQTLLAPLAEDDHLHNWLCQVSYDGGLWKFHVDLLRKMNKLNEYVAVSLSLADITLLNNEELLLLHFREKNNWVALCEMVSRMSLNEDQETVNCLGCGETRGCNSLTWNQVVQFVRENNSERDTVDILKSCEQMPDKVISPTLCLSLVTSAILSGYQSSTSRRKLDELSAYLVKSDTVDDGSLDAIKTRNWILKLNLSEECCAKCGLSRCFFRFLYTCIKKRVNN